jgi:hypothetical protein
MRFKAVLAAIVGRNITTIIDRRRGDSLAVGDDLDNGRVTEWCSSISKACHVTSF